jgi:hypothetical protein
MNAHLYSRRELLKKGSAAAAGLLAWGAGPPAWAQFPMKQINVLCTGPARPAAFPTSWI